MRKYIYILFIFAIILASCKTNEEPQSSPRYAMSEMVVRHADSTLPQDTLKVKMDEEDILIDSISVGDTVSFAILCSAVTNQLTAFTVTNDTAVLAMRMILNKNHTDALDASSDVENCRLVFKRGYGAASIPMEYIARKSVTATFSFKLETTSEYSPATLTFKQPIR